MQVNMKISKRIISLFMTFALILTGIGVIPAKVKAANEATVVSSVGQTYIEQRKIDDYVNGVAPKPTKEEYANWLFAGWYKDSACSASNIISNTKNMTGTYYAKFVPEEVLSVKYQVATGTTSSSTTSQMRLLSTVDNLSYKHVGFIIEIDDINYNKTHTTSTVYQTITASSGGVAFEKKPNIFQFTSSKYFATVTLANIPNEAFTSAIRVTPFWETMDGAVVKGVSRTVRVSDTYGQTVNVPVTVYSDATVAANNSVTVSYDPTLYTYAGTDRGTITDKLGITNDATAGTVTCTVQQSIAAEGMLANFRFTKKTQVLDTKGFKIASETVSDWNSSCQVYHSLKEANTDGNFSKEDLRDYSIPAYDNNVTSATSQAIVKTVTTTGIQYNFKVTGGAIRIISIENAIFNTADFTKLTVKIRDTAKTAFERWRLYINPDVNNTNVKAGTLLVDVAKTGAYSVSPLTVSEADANGWVTVTFDLANMPQWVGAGTVKGFSIGYVNRGTTQEIGEISFSQTGETLFADVMTGKDLSTHSTAVYNRDTTSATTTNIVEAVNNNGVSYKFNTAGNGHRTVVVTNVSINTADYSSVTIKVRDTAKTGFTRFDFYINSRLASGNDALGTAIYNATGLTAGAAISNDNVTISAPDADGWVNVTFHLKNRDAWNSAGTINAFCFGYLNTGNEQQIAEIRFERANQKDISASSIYNMATAYNNNDPSRAVVTTLQDTGVKYDFLDYSKDAMKNIYIEDLKLNPKEYNRLTFRMRSLSTDASGNSYGFTRWILYINPDSGTSGTGTKVLDNGANLNAAGITVSAADANGWVTVTMDMGNVPEWYAADVITGLNIGYVNQGACQEIASMKFDSSKSTQGNLSTTYLKQYGATPVYYGSSVTSASEMTEYSKKLVLGEGVQCSYSPTAQVGGNKGIKLTELNIPTSKYDTMKVRVRTTGEYGFDRYKLWLATDTNSTLTMELDADSLGNEVVMQSAPDAEGWITVSMDVSTISKYANANTVTALCFSTVCYNPTLEIKDIAFCDTKGTLTASTIYEYATPYKYATTTETGTKSSQSTGARFTYTTASNGALKAIHVKKENWSLITGRYDTLTVKIRDINKTAFTRWRLYLDTDLRDNTNRNATADVDTGVIAAGAYSSDLVTVSSADSNGWVTVKINLGNVPAWTNANVVNDFVIGYVNTGSSQEIASIQFTRAASVQLNYSSASYLSQRYAYLLRTEVPGLENATYSTSKSDTKKDIEFVTDTNLAAGTGKMTVGAASTGADITCAVADYYGLEAVIDYLQMHGCVMTPGAAITVDHTDHMTSLESATQYAHNKTGEIRVMSYNSLWHAEYTASSGDRLEFGSNDQRNNLQAKMIEQYMPDVLGMQERGDVGTGFDGRSGLNTNLENLGYTEVQRNKRSSNYIPLWYNSATMKEIASGYTEYKSTTLGTDTDRGKGYTWAVLESLTTQEQLLVVNTHMITDDSYNSKQAKDELAVKVNSLVSTYPNIPVMVIGDMNSNNSVDTAYKYFKNTLGYTDPAATATVKSTPRAHHGIPFTSYKGSNTLASQNGMPVNNGLLDIVVPNSSVIQSTYQGQNSVDHILFKDVTKINMKVFGVVVDDVTNSTSDHYPIFVDFDLN